MTDRPHCMKPYDCPAKPGRHCIKCHARRNAINNQAKGVAQTPEAREKRVRSYLATRMSYVPKGMEDVNKTLREKRIYTDERRRMFGAQEVAENQRDMRRRHERSKQQEY